MEPMHLRTDRLHLRRWRPEDLEPFADLNADPVVMEFFPRTLSRGESDAFADRIEQHFEEHGFGLWAVEVVDGGEFAGYVGLWSATFDASFTPAVEVGWRIARRFWGRGLAPEGARTVVADGFDRLGLPGIVSFTSVINTRSRRVMEKIGMSHDPGEDFDHPAVAANSPLRPHVLYRLTPADLDRG